MSQQMDWTGYGASAAELYERYLVPAIFEPWAMALVALAAPQPGERVLDVACGTGTVARLAAQHVGHTGQVTGLDLNPGMLAVARELPPPQGVQIAWQEGNAMAMPLADAAFDVVLCQQGLQFFPDRAAALREMHRVLAPGGRVALSVWRPMHYSPGFAILAEALGRNVAPEAATTMHDPFALGEAEVLHALLAGATFRNVALRPTIKTVRFPSPEEFVQRYMAASRLAGMVAQVSNDAWAALLAEVKAALGAYIDTEGLAFPSEAHLVVAQR